MKIISVMFGTLALTLITPALALGQEDAGSAQPPVPGVNPAFLPQSLFKDNNGSGTYELAAFGDSITRGTGDFTSPGEEVSEPYQPADGEEAGFPLRLENRLGIQVSDLGDPGERIVNEGIYRFAANVPRVRPDLIFIAGGSNDAIFRVDPEELARTYQAMINISVASGITPILVNIPPSCCEHSGLELSTQQYNIRMSELARINNLAMADVRHAFNNTCQNDDCNLLNLPEGLHPNTAGYDIMGESVLAAALQINLFAPEGPATLETALNLAPGSVDTVPDQAPAATP